MSKLGLRVVLHSQAGASSRFTFPSWGLGTRVIIPIKYNRYIDAGSQAPAWEPILGSSSFPFFRLFTKPSLLFRAIILVLCPRKQNLRLIGLRTKPVLVSISQKITAMPRGNSSFYIHISRESQTPFHIRSLFANPLKDQAGVDRRL